MEITSSRDGYTGRITKVEPKVVWAAMDAKIARSPTSFKIDVLKEIHCIDYCLVVQIKDRVVCEMNYGEELICTECLFENQLDDLEPEEAVALLSALVFQQKNTSESSLTPKLALAKQRYITWMAGDYGAIPFGSSCLFVLFKIYYLEEKDSQAAGEPKWKGWWLISLLKMLLLRVA